MAHTTPQVRDGHLVHPVGAEGQTLVVGSADWHRWLDDAQTTTFHFVHSAGSFTARKERRRWGGYWYAYRTQGGRLRKGYLGRTDDLTLPRLVEVAARLEREHAAPPLRESEEREMGDAPTPSPSPPTPVSDAEVAPDVADALLATKLYLPPPRPDWVPRPRLTACLDAGLRGPLTLIVAPAGCGKTTLLADWRAGRHKDAGNALWPLAWLALDVGDNDLARFLRYVVAAVQSLRVDLGRATLASLRSAQPPPVEALVTLLLNDLTALPDEVVLVLDDYHVITDAAVHQALAFLLDHLPPRLHLVIATRAEPPLPLARLRARGQLAELRAADLRFSAEEAASFLQRTMGLPLAADDVATLEERTEGWIAGLQLAALALRGRETAHLRDAVAALAGTHRYILDYLADEVFERQPAEVQAFLLHTSVLDRLSGPLCDALLAAAGHADSATGAARPGGAGQGQAMLEQLEAANLFLVPLDDTRTWYRYHHLFADFLRERLRRAQPDLVPALHRRACRWHEQQGLLAEAADHALAAHEPALAARLIERVSATLLWQRGELATLLRWLEHVPRDVIRTRPRLCLDLAWVLVLSARPDAVERQLRDAEHALATSQLPDAPEGRESTTEAAVGLADAWPHASSRALRGEIAAIRAELARRHGDSAAAVALAHQALADLPADARWARGGATAFLASAYLSRGDAAAASRTYAEAVAVSQTPGTITLAVFASGRLVLSQALAGQLHQAAATYRRTLDLATSQGLAATPAIGAAQVGMAEVRREWNDLDGAEDLARPGIASCTDANGMWQMAVDGALTLARVRQARGDTAGALAVLAEAETLGRERHVAQYAERVAAERARLWLTTTPPDVDATARWAAGRAAVWQADGDAIPDYVGVLERLTLARLHLAQGQHAAAAALLRRLLARAEAGSLVGCALEILALQARLSLEQDQMAQAMIALGRALALAEPEGYIRAFLDEGAPMVALLRQARARGVAPAYVAALLAACGDAAQVASSATSALIDPLSARELEVLRLLVAGLSTPEIAAQLFITAGTARIHLKNIYRKLDVHNRLQAVERTRTLALV